MFNSVLTNASFDVWNCLFCILTSIGCGLALSITFMKTDERYSKNLVAALIIIPAVSTVVIMAVNNSLGVGVAIAGAFALVRFRSQPGNARAMATVFSSLAAGILCGTGFLLFAAMFTGIVVVILIVLKITKFCGEDEREKILKIDIPEDLNYENIFDGILKTYTAHSTLDSVRTTNMGSMFELKYSIFLKKDANVKKMLDEIRTLNANLPVQCVTKKFSNDEL